MLAISKSEMVNSADFVQIHDSFVSSESSLNTYRPFPSARMYLCEQTMEFQKKKVEFNNILLDASQSSVIQSIKIQYFHRLDEGLHSPMILNSIPERNPSPTLTVGCVWISVHLSEK